MKALIIDEPWIGKILAGSKTWEMRKTVCNLRGPIALIRKGSGSVVGTAEIVGSLPALGCREAYARAETHHGIPSDRQQTAFADGWRTPWVLQNARALSEPVPYDHPSGAVIWVNLSERVMSAIRAQADSYGNAILASKPLARPAERAVEPRPSPVSDGAERLISITQGNINNGHIYLPLDMFPADALGGSNKDQAADRKVTVQFLPGQTVSSDIDRTKRILRSRGPVREFLERAGLEAGDRIRLTRTGPYSYDITKAPAHG